MNEANEFNQNMTALDLLKNTVLDTVKWQDTKFGDLNHAALGLPGEAGEFSDLVKKITIYKSRDLNDPKVLKSLGLELGDTLWYIQLAALVLGFTIEELIVMNREKLGLRYPEGFTVEASEAKIDKQITGEIE